MSIEKPTKILGGFLFVPRADNFSRNEKLLASLAYRKYIRKLIIFQQNSQ